MKEIIRDVRRKGFVETDKIAAIGGAGDCAGQLLGAKAQRGALFPAVENVVRVFAEQGTGGIEFHNSAFQRQAGIREQQFGTDETGCVRLPADRRETMLVRDGNGG